MIAVDRTRDAAAREAGMNAARTVVMIDVFVFKPAQWKKGVRMELVV